MGAIDSNINMENVHCVIAVTINKSISNYFNGSLFDVKRNRASSGTSKIKAVAKTPV